MGLDAAQLPDEQSVRDPSSITHRMFYSGHVSHADMPLVRYIYLIGLRRATLILRLAVVCGEAQ